VVISEQSAQPLYHMVLMPLNCHSAVYTVQQLICDTAFPSVPSFGLGEIQRVRKPCIIRKSRGIFYHVVKLFNRGILRFAFFKLRDISWFCEKRNFITCTKTIATSGKNEVNSRGITWLMVIWSGSNQTDGF
jgi:hypothetical protein